MELRNMPKATEYLLQIPMWTRKKNSISQVQDMLQALGDPESQMHILHVAGTNGKGSVCADMTAILMEAGYQVGTFVSPHLVDVRERMLKNGVMISQEEFQAIFETVFLVVEDQMIKGYCHPTFFEYLFYMAMAWFAEKKPDYVILETGLGGRLDTTNAIRRPEGVVITSISLDHTQYLGNTIGQIAGEKAGIIKPGAFVVYDDNEPEASRVIRERILELGGKSRSIAMNQVENQDSFLAPYQKMNGALASSLLLELAIPGIDELLCKKGLSKVQWPGRMEQVAEDVWFDGAHNPGGIAALIQAVQALEKKEHKNNQILFAAVADKDYNEMAEALCRSLHPTTVTVARLSSERGLEEGVLGDLFQKLGYPGVEICDTAAKAWKLAYGHKTKEDRLLIVGSLYLIGEIKEALRR